MTGTKQKSLPSLATAGCSLARRKRLRRLRHATLTELVGMQAASRTPLRDDLGGDAADAGAGQADGAGGAGRQIEHAAADERSTVIDGHDDAAAAMGDAQLGAERQRAVGAGHGAGVHALARRGPVAGLIAVIGGHAREAAPGARDGAHGGIGVEPGRAGGGLSAHAGVMVMVVPGVMVMPGMGRGFGNAPAEHDSRGDNSERRARPGYSSQCRLFGYDHIIVPQNSIATYVTSGTPAPTTMGRRLMTE